MNEILSFAIELAKNTGSLLLRYYLSEDLSTSFKEDHSLVTQADLEADAFISIAIKNRFPGDLLLSEEISPDLPNRAAQTDEAIWIIDPLDGTTNFTLGLPFWGISLARLINGEPTLAVLYFPVLKELYSAEKGCGATMNQNPLRIQPDLNRKLAFFSCCSRTFRRYQVEIPYKTRILGCASYTFCAVARNMSVIGFEATPKLWDLAAAWLVVEESGGEIAVLAGDSPFPIRTTVQYADQYFPTLAAASQERLSWAKQRIQPKQGASFSRD